MTDDKEQPKYKNPADTKAYKRRAYKKAHNTKKPKYVILDAEDALKKSKKPIKSTATKSKSNKPKSKSKSKSKK